jgi:predicted nucleotidyltransferase
MSGTMDPALFKFLGKRGRIELIKLLIKYPKRKFSIRELSRETGVPVMTMQRAVWEFFHLGIVHFDHVGTSHIITLNENSKIMKELINLRLSSPHRDAAKEFAKKISKTKGVLACYLFGSTSSLKHKTSSDVDVAVIYDKQKTTRRKLETKAVELIMSIADAIHITL